MFMGACGCMCCETKHLSGGHSASMNFSTAVACFMLTCLLAGSCGTDCRVSKPESELSRLKRELSCGYDSSASPDVSRNSSTLVHLSLVLRRFTLIEEYERIEVYYGAILTWTDVRLKWDPSHFGNIKQFYTNSSLIWTPEIGWVTMDTYSDRLYMGMIPCLLAWSGRVVCVSWSSFHSTCQSDLTHWPYDSHECEAQLAAWILQHRELELLPHISENPFYERNSEWALQNAVMERRSDLFENNTFQYAALTLTLARHSATHVAIIVVPAAVLIVLTLASSWIEAKSSNRLSLLCSVIICHILYLQYIGMNLFNNGISCPLIVLLYRDSTLVCGLSLVVTLVVRWMICNPAMPPAWVSGFAMKVQESRPGQLFGLLLLQDSRQVADREGVETPCEAGPNWRLIGTMLDRISFIAFSVTYIILLITYYLYYL